LNAIQALSQLSYGPIFASGVGKPGCRCRPGTGIGRT
jgi:hypothetical protein